MKKELSVLIRDEVRDERILGTMISVTTVQTTQDLKYAKVYVSVFGGEKKEILAVLNKSAAMLKNELFHRLKIRAVPNLTFYLDESADYAQKIETILKTIKQDEKKEEN
jgi:ribosome-binding factor A